MNRDDLLLVLSALLLVLGAAVVWSGFHHEPGPARQPSMLRVPIVVSLVTGSLVVAVSGWIIPAVVVGAIVGWLANSVRHRQGAVDTGVERTEALASWVENVRDVLQSGNQPVGAIGATTETCPPSIRPHVRLLFARLSAGQPAELAFRRFADDMDEPLADLVAVGLLIAVSRGAETQDVLSALAVQARHQADRRRIVEAERAPMRREVTMVSLVMCALLAGVFLFARSSYLNAYDDVSGQIFLALILVGYGALLVWVGRLATFAPSVAISDPSPGGLMNSAARLIVATLLGAGGVWLIVGGLAQRRPSLVKMAAHLGRTQLVLSVPVDGWGRVGRTLVRRVPLGSDVVADLRLIRRTQEVHAAYLVVAAVAGLFGPSLLSAIGQGIGLFSMGLVLPMAVSVFCAIAAPLLVHSSMRSTAAAERNDLRYQLSSYLDVVTMLLAGNVGNEGALRQAAQAGDGRLFVELRRRILIAETSNRSLVSALGQLGDDLDLIELQQISASASLAASAGAPVARSLAAKCATLRSALSAEQETDARVRTGKITVPLVGMSLLIMAAVVYPALNFSR